MKHYHHWTCCYWTHIVCVFIFALFVTFLAKRWDFAWRARVQTSKSLPPPHSLRALDNSLSVFFFFFSYFDNDRRKDLQFIGAVVTFLLVVRFILNTILLLFNTSSPNSCLFLFSVHSGSSNAERKWNRRRKKKLYEARSLIKQTNKLVTSKSMIPHIWSRFMRRYIEDRLRF